MLTFFYLMSLVSLLFKEHVVAHYCAAVNKVPQQANAIAPWTEPTEMERILMWDQDSYTRSNRPQIKVLLFDYPANAQRDVQITTHDVVWHNPPACQSLEQSTPGPTHLSCTESFFLFHNSPGGGGVNHKPNMDGSSTMAMLHRLASIRAIY